jgi:flavin-dependent dehydrogenase
MTSLRPVEIVGGGLAGLSLGLALRREGVPVTIFEAGSYPRHRVCGEFITGLEPETIRKLDLAPMLADALAHREVAWFFGETRVRDQALPSPALGLSRHALDARLAAAFVAAGGTLLERTRITDGSRSGRVWANGRRRGNSPWLGLKFHVRGLALTRDLELHLGSECYVGLSRVEDHVVNVCGLFRRRALAARGPQLLHDYLRACGLGSLAARIAAARVDAESFCAVAALSFEPMRTVPGEIRVGDAGGMMPPFTGNGMAVAFQSAAVVLEPLLAFTRGARTWEETCAAANVALRRRFRLRLASANALHPFLLRPRRQRWLARLNRARLIPLAPLYAATH